MLAAGGIVAFTDEATEADRVRVSMEYYDNEGKLIGKPVRARLDAVVVPIGPAGAGPPGGAVRRRPPSASGSRSSRSA